MSQPKLRRTRIVCISDTHNCTVKLPEGDVLIHAGDLTNQGSYSEVSIRKDTIYYTSANQGHLNSFQKLSNGWKKPSSKPRLSSPVRGQRLRGLQSHITLTRLSQVITTSL